MTSRLHPALASTGVTLAAALTLAITAEAQERVHWKMQSAFGSQLAHLGTSGVRFTKNIERVSGGAFEIKFFEPGALVPALECFEAASKGSVEACWTTPGYHTGKYPALAFFSSVPFGPGYGEFFAWKKFGGGDELKNEIYA
jgi:TRAP-type mannitol/chloroaromatic compound transport system substrate-binding protein